MATHDDLPSTSEWVKRWTRSIPKGGMVLDLACGRGRHAIYLAKLGYYVYAVEKDPQLVKGLNGAVGIEVVEFDLESEPWPFCPESFDGVIVTNYLHRPLFPNLIITIKANGILIYETFAHGNEKYGKPSNPNFLLQSGELLEVVRGK